MLEGVYRLLRWAHYEPRRVVFFFFFFQPLFITVEAIAVAELM